MTGRPADPPRAAGPRAAGPRAVAARVTVTRVLRVAGVGLVIILALVAILTALRTELPRSPGVMSDALGPESGEQVDDYLARATASLAGDDDAPRWALVTAGRAWTVSEAADVVRELPRVSGLYVQVPVPGVAMPVSGVTLSEPPAGESGRGPVFQRGLDQVVRRLDVGLSAGAGVPTPTDSAPTDSAPTDAARNDADRAAAGTALTVTRLQAGDPAIVGLLARGTSAQLRAVTEQPGVRAVEALPADAVWERFAVRPLQPQQIDAALPLPDDGLVPAA